MARDGEMCRGKDRIYPFGILGHSRDARNYLYSFFQWSGVPWGNQRCDGKSKLSSFFYLHANVVIVINPMRSGCLWFWRNVLSSQNKKASQLTQRLKTQWLKFREWGKENPGKSSSFIGASIGD